MENKILIGCAKEEKKKIRWHLNKYENMQGFIIEKKVARKMGDL